MNTHKKGYSLERAVAEALRKKGFRVILTPQSWDFGADIIAEKGERRIAIQVKNTRDKVGVKAIQEVLGGKEYYKCNEAWVVSKSGFTKNAWELADKANVRLIYAGELIDSLGISQELKTNGYVPYVDPIRVLARILLLVFLILLLGYPFYYKPKAPSQPVTNINNMVKVSEQEGIEIILPILIIPEIPNRTVLFFDDFEKYKIGYIMGQQNGWFPVWGWTGKSFEQKVIASIAVSGNKSFQLWGDPCISAGYYRYLYFNNSYLQLRKMNNSIGVETYIGIESYGNPKCRDRFEKNATVALIGFWNSYDKRYYATVVFKRDSGIYANGIQIGKWEPKKWYHLRIIMNWQKGTFDVYINGQKNGSSIAINKFDARYYTYDGVVIASGHAGVRVFFDNFMIFITE